MSFRSKVVLLKTIGKWQKVGERTLTLSISLSQLTKLIWEQFYVLLQIAIFPQLKLTLCSTVFFNNSTLYCTDPLFVHQSIIICILISLRDNWTISSYSPPRVQWWCWTGGWCCFMIRSIPRVWLRAKIFPAVDNVRAVVTATSNRQKNELWMASNEFHFPA